MMISTTSFSCTFEASSTCAIWRARRRSILGVTSIRFSCTRHRTRMQSRFCVCVRVCACVSVRVCVRVCHLNEHQAKRRRRKTTAATRTIPQPKQQEQQRKTTRGWPINGAPKSTADLAVDKREDGVIGLLFCSSLQQLHNRPDVVQTLETRKRTGAMHGKVTMIYSSNSSSNNSSKGRGEREDGKGTGEPRAASRGKKSHYGTAGAAGGRMAPL